MLTKADDYPIHQTPEPIAYSGTDRNFYDRYFFNGYHREGDLFFAAALGVYPHLNIMDAAFCVICGGKQYNVHASKVLHMERLDTRVGPIEVEVIEPLQVLRVTCKDEENGIEADVCFNARTAAIEEPRFTRRVVQLRVAESLAMHPAALPTVIAAALFSTRPQLLSPAQQNRAAAVALVALLGLWAIRLLPAI